MNCFRFCLLWDVVTYVSTTLVCKAKKQYLLTLQVSRFCLLALHGRTQNAWLRNHHLSVIRTDKLCLFLWFSRCQITYCHTYTKVFDIPTHYLGLCQIPTHYSTTWSFVLLPRPITVTIQVGFLGATNTYVWQCYRQPLTWFHNNQICYVMLILRLYTRHDIVIM